MKNVFRGEIEKKKFISFEAGREEKSKAKSH